MAPSLSTHKPKPAGNMSPIFPTEAFSNIDSSLKLPENEIISAGSVSLSIVLAEPILFLRGFAPEEYTERSPSLLRGTLIVRVHKSTKIKAISLTFKGIARTDWPEGIPPKKSELMEIKELHSHTWPFFNAAFPTSDYSSGANMIKLHKDSSHHRTLSFDPFDKISGSSLPLGHTSSHKRSESSDRNEHSPTRGRSNTISSETSDSSSTTPSTRGVRGLAGRLRRAASPSPSFSKEPFLHSLNLGPRRSFSKDEPVDLETTSKGYRTFEPGEYYYNFELPIPQSLPESIYANFGSVHYFLEASIDRHGAFKTRVSGTKDVVLVRCPADNNTEINEPIAISKQWEDQLEYDIVISDAEPGKRKHYEISIDSPIHLLDSKCTSSNVYLPAYIDPVSRRTSIASMRPLPTGTNPDFRPIHYLRKPSLAPPPFSADVPPPSIARAQADIEPSAINDDAPPNYEEVTGNESGSSSYFERFERYKIQRQKSRDEREALLRQKEQERRQRRPSVIVEGQAQTSAAILAGLPGHEMTNSTVSLTSSAEERSVSSQENDQSNDSSRSTRLNTTMFSNQGNSQTTEAPVYTPASLLQQHQQRFQSTTSSVDIVDQTRDLGTSPAPFQSNTLASSFNGASGSSNIVATNPQTSASRNSASQAAIASVSDEIDPCDPLSPVMASMGSLQPVESAASSTYDSGEQLEELMPKLYMGSLPIERQGLLQSQHPTMTRSVSGKSIGDPGMRDRLESSADLGLAANSSLDDDQVSLTSTPSLWIS